MEPEVTVLLPVRNGEAYLADAIESVLSQSCRRLRLVVSNNGSTDQTLAVASRFLGDDRVVLLDQADPTDAVGHFNRLLERISTRYFMLLCHDDYLCDVDALARALVALENRPDVAAAFCDLAFVDAAGDLIRVRTFGREGLADGAAISRQSVKAARNLFGIPLLIRAEAAHGLLYDKSLLYAADLDFAIALAGHGPVYHIAEPLIANRYHGRNATAGLFSTALGQMRIIAAKNRITLSLLDRLAMLAGAAAVGVQKWIFFQYLARVRRPRPGRRYMRQKPEARG
jgi:glycosyltransferase involved in cell wall biosynthesis